MILASPSKMGWLLSPARYIFLIQWTPFKFPVENVSFITTSTKKMIPPFFFPFLSGF
jgi:hypothetical protein